MFGLNELYESLLLEAKSPEEIKKILEYQFVEGKGVPQEVLDAIFEIDPTKKKSYTKWTLMQWDNYRDAILEFLKSGKLKRLFTYFQSRAGSGLQLTAMENFQKAVEMLPDEDPILDKEGNGGPEDDFDIVFKSSEWIIAVPHTYEADKKLGRGCRWCTAGAFGDNDHYWKQYSQYGPLWINFDLRGKETCPMDHKEYPYIRYQFLFEYQNWHGELMDCHDNRITFDEVDMPEDAIEFYGEQNERYKEIIENGAEEDMETRWENYNEERMEHSHTVLCYEDEYLTLMPEEAQEPVFDENCYYYLYDENRDMADPISYDTFNPESQYVVQSFDGYPIVFLRPNNYDENEVLVATCDETTGNNRWCRYSFNLFSYVKFYGEIGHFAYFIAGDCEMRLYDEEGCYFAFELPFDNDDIEKIFIPRIDASEIEGFDTGYWMEIASKDGYHSLYFLNTNDVGVETIVRKDFPRNQNFFEISFDDNGNAYVDGLYSRHWLAKDKNRENNAFDIVEEIFDNYYVVEVDENENGLKYYSIYDNEAKKIILDESFHNYDIVCDGLLKLVYISNGDRTFRLFNVYEGKYMSPLCEQIIIRNKIVQLHNPVGREIGVYFSEIGENGVVHYLDAKCAGVVKYLCDAYYLVHMQGDSRDIKLLNLRTKKVSMEDGITIYGELSEYGSTLENPYIFIKTKDAVINLYDFVNDRTVLTHLWATRPEVVTTLNGKNVFKFKFDNNSYNLFCDGKTLLPQNAFVLPCYPDEYRTRIFNFESDGRLFFYDLSNNKLLPSKEGINAKQAHVNYCRGGVYKMETLINPKVYFYYNPSTNDISLDNNEEMSPEVKELLQSIMFPQAAQISENFKTTYRKIINARNNF